MANASKIIQGACSNLTTMVLIERHKQRVISNSRLLVMLTVVFLIGFNCGFISQKETNRSRELLSKTSVPVIKDQTPLCVTNTKMGARNVTHQPENTKSTQKPSKPPKLEKIKESSKLYEVEIETKVLPVKAENEPVNKSLPLASKNLKLDKEAEDLTATYPFTARKLQPLLQSSEQSEPKPGTEQDKIPDDAHAPDFRENRTVFFLETKESTLPTRSLLCAAESASNVYKDYDVSI